jgi:hypothetical protein
MNYDRFSKMFQGAAPQMNDVVTPFPLALPATGPSLMACPVHPAMMMTTMQDLYRIAHENAVAATRTSRFELAMMACPN